MSTKRPSHSIAALMPRDFHRLRATSHKAFAGAEATWEDRSGAWRLRRIRAVYSLTLPRPIWHVLRRNFAGAPNRWDLVGRHSTLPAALRTLARHRGPKQRATA